jgi:hypothetical protein
MITISPYNKNFIKYNSKSEEFLINISNFLSFCFINNNLDNTPIFLELTKEDNDLLNFSLENNNNFVKIGVTYINKKLIAFVSVQDDNFIKIITTDGKEHYKSFYNFTAHEALNIIFDSLNSSGLSNNE